MDIKDFTVTESEQETQKPVTKTRQTNPIAKKFIKFQNNKEKFCVKDLFKIVRD